MQQTGWVFITALALMAVVDGQNCTVWNNCTSTTSSTTTTSTTTVAGTVVTGVTANAAQGDTTISVSDARDFSNGDLFTTSTTAAQTFLILNRVYTRRLEENGRRLQLFPSLPGILGFFPGLTAAVPAGSTITRAATGTITTTTEMPWGFPWFGWMLLCCGLCCCLSLCCGGPLGALPFLGGKKKPTKTPSPVAQPTVVEEVVTVEDEVPMMGGGVPMASMAVPMASAGYPMASGYPTTGYPASGYPNTGYPMAY